MEGAESESAFQSRLCKLARVQGWKVYRAHGSRNKPVDAGFVDLVLCKPGRAVIFAELKADRGKVDADQGGWHEALVAAGASVRVWRPRDWESIECELSS